MRKTYPALAVSAAAVAAALATGVAQSAGTPAGPASSASPASSTSSTSSGGVVPSDFTHPVANPWYPLDPGLVTILRGSEDGQRFRERVRVTDRTRVIVGVTTRAVRDVLRRADGSVAEATTDWYAADNSGNVWYFGEKTATYDRHGHVTSREGTWRAGVDGARAGLIMPANPRATDAYRQEYYPGHAEDQAWIVGHKASLRTPLRRFRHVLRTFEWSRLEPGVVSVKFYARGVGIVRERDVAGGTETFAVVGVHRR